MSVVWAFIKEGKGYVFGDGNTTQKVNENGVDKFIVIESDFKKVFKVNKNGNSLIGGFTGKMKMHYKPISEHFIECFQDFKFKDDESIRLQIENYFTPKAKEIEEPWHWFAVVITQDMTLLHIEFDSNKDACIAKTIDQKSCTIGDKETLDSRVKEFDSILIGGVKPLNEYLDKFNYVKDNLCTPVAVGGKTSHLTLP